ARAIVISLACLLVFRGPWMLTGECGEFASTRDLCRQLVFDGDMKAARPVAENLLAIAQREYGASQQETVEALHWAALVHRECGDFEKAREEPSRSLRIQESLPNRDAIWYSRALLMLGEIHLKLCHFQEAKQFLLRALEVREGFLG